MQLMKAINCAFCSIAFAKCRCVAILGHVFECAAWLRLVVLFDEEECLLQTLCRFLFYWTTRAIFCWTLPRSVSTGNWTVPRQRALWVTLCDMGNAACVCAWASWTASWSTECSARFIVWSWCGVPLIGRLFRSELADWANCASLKLCKLATFFLFHFKAPRGGRRTDPLSAKRASFASILMIWMRRKLTRFVVQRAFKYDHISSALVYLSRAHTVWQKTCCPTTTVTDPLSSIP